MTMDLQDNALFKSFLKALSTDKLDALEDWQDERMSGNPNKEADCLMRKDLISAERSRRGNTGH